jgi:Zn-dependent peptidase ImmA (M78 family)/DNA-binding XRE family transcriptional regulator
MIYGERIRQARELNKLTQKELADKVGCKQSAIAHFETDRSQPSIDLVRAIGKVTGFLDIFFEREPITNFAMGSLVYRSRHSCTKADKSQIYQYSKTIYEHIKIMTDKVNLPEMRLPRITEKPTLSAKVTRAALGIAPESPISNLTYIFEKNGGVVIAAPFSLPKIDASSSWIELEIDRPMIITSSYIPGDRLRFSIAHEIGHLVMHNPCNTTKLINLEKDADKFASEFLMPSDAIKRDLISPITLTSIMRLKQKWGVSLQALIYKAYDLELITERHYHYLFQQLYSKGWRKSEPEELAVPIETPQAFNRILQVSYFDIQDYALDMGLEPSQAKSIAAFN